MSEPPRRPEPPVEGAPGAGEPTFSVGELHDRLGALIESNFGSVVWVSGELRDLHRSAAGHAYFDLVDTEADADNPPSLSVTLFDRQRQWVNRQLRRAGASGAMAEGTVLRISGELGTYPSRSRLQLVMSGIDPTFTIGAMAQRRERTLAQLAAEGLLELNAAIPLARPALRLAVVTSRHSAAHADVLDELVRSGIGFEVVVIDTRTQGLAAAAGIAGAVARAASLAPDAVLVVRGGGARTDLAVFDTEEVARAIATSPVPVITGIGHETDTTVADVVAHRAHKTPTAAAGSVVADARAAELDLLGAGRSVRSAAQGRLTRAGVELQRLRRSTAMACRGHLGREEQVVAARAARVADSATRSLASAGTRLDAASGALGPRVAGRLERDDRRLAHLSELVAAHDPAHALARGWSITRGPDGAVLRDPSTLREGDRVSTRVAAGSFESTVSRTGDPLDG